VLRTITKETAALSMRNLPLASSVAAAVLLLVTAPRLAAAQPAEAARPAAAPGDAPAPAGDLRPPTLEKRVEATYPEDAKRDHLEANVGLELVIDEEGRVVDAKVTSPVGHGFDEAAIAAARAFVFAPARQGATPIRSSVQFTYEFHLPPDAVAPPPPAPVPVAIPTPTTTPAEVRQTGADQSTLVLAQRPISAASSSSVRDREFQLRPIGSVQDILRVTPGLVLVQHSGGGKANQYFLRGFDADHGTDLALSIDGIPINMVSHAHGQGYSDTNFIIPEVVERVEISKGPYFANQGDFATAGAINMVSRDDFEHSSVGLGISGSPGHGALGYRGLLIASPKFESGVKATFAAEVGRQNGPFDNPENWDKYKLFNKLTVPINGASSITIGEMSYGGAWHGSGQIPARAVERGTVSRFGSIDPDEGGYTSRHQLFVQYKLRPSDNSELKALAYIGAYKFNLYSNFTLFARDPENGDEIEQVDRRTFYGGKLSYRIVHEIEGVRFDSTFGGDARSDDIQEQLWNTVHRVQTAQVRGNAVHETLIGAFFNEEITPVKWLRANVGGRADMLAFAVDSTFAAAGDTGAPKSGIDSAHQLSPKTSLVLSPLQSGPAQLDLFVNYGHGFHSNDVRGAFSTPAVTPLTRAIGSEVGARARLLDRWDVAAALWQLDLQNETVWNGDDGTTGVSGPTNRHGIELESRFEITKWLSLDGDVTFTKSQFSTDGANGGGLALAPKQTYSGGISARHEAGPGLARGGLRFYGITDRPASDDGQLIAPGFTMFDLHAGYRLRRFDLAFDVENLFNQASRSAQFATVGRLRNEPAIGGAVPPGFNCGSNGRLASDPAVPAGRFAGCEDVHFTPQYPTTLRVMATVFLD
jgi:TonB family protein